MDVPGASLDEAQMAAAVSRILTSESGLNLAGKAISKTIKQRNNYSYLRRAVCLGFALVHEFIPASTMSPAGYVLPDGVVTVLRGQHGNGDAVKAVEGFIESRSAAKAIAGKLGDLDDTHRTTSTPREIPNYVLMLAGAAMLAVVAYNKSGKQLSMPV
jgi:hypothetical protein